LITTTLKREMTKRSKIMDATRAFCLLAMAARGDDHDVPTR
jgi:hypothetical protein